MFFTAEQLQTLPINSGALRFLPESVARENTVLPIRIEGRKLQVVLPAVNQNADADLLDKLRFVLNMEISCDLANPEDLEPIINQHYTEVNSEILNCDFKPAFTCPKRWSDLQVTSNHDVRFCTMCQKDVTFCRTPEDLERLTAAGACVAFLHPIDQSTAPAEFLGYLDSYEMCP